MRQLGEGAQPKLCERLPVILRLMVLVSVLVLELTSERGLKAEVQAQACKSTVIGTLEMVPLESKVYGDKRLMRVWLPTGYSNSKASAKRYVARYSPAAAES